MSDADSIMILSACTATKTAVGRKRPVLAEELYMGQQHRRLMRGVRDYRAAGEPAGRLDLHILSAQHGVVAAHDSLRSYNATFTGLRRAQLRRRATKLGVPTAVANLLEARRRLAVLLLGESYLRAAELQSVAPLGAPTLILTSPNAARHLPAQPGLHVVELDNRDARRFSCGLVALKGELAARLLVGLAASPRGPLLFEPAELLGRLEQMPSPQADGSAELPLLEAA